jgi:hypothetical protein
MEVKITTWKVSTLYKLKDKINEQPVYQRGEVWKPKKKSILIDSMLRGIDLPKIYLRKLSNNAHDYEVADGQQRLRAIYDFLDRKISLLDQEEKGLNLGRIDGKIVGGKYYDKLPKDLKDKFDNYEVTITIIEKATNAEIRTLFGRLQEGDPLVPAEKRNAIISTLGSLIDNFAINHDFFERSRISAERFKRQDYMAHILALILYGNKDSLKADLLLKMYLDKKIILSQARQKIIAEVLDVMKLIDEDSTTRIYKKYHFIDIFSILFANSTKLKNIDPKTFAKTFDTFEVSRLHNSDNPELLIENKRPSAKEKDLYEYINSFRYNGAEPESIDKRNAVFQNLFRKHF